MRWRSDSDPTRMPTSVSDTGDVAPVLHAVEGNEVDGRVHAVACLANGRSGRGHGEDSAPVRDHRAVSYRRAAMKDERPGGFGVGESRDLGARQVAAPGV